MIAAFGGAVGQRFARRQALGTVRRMVAVIVLGDGFMRLVKLPILSPMQWVIAHPEPVWMHTATLPTVQNCRILVTLRDLCDVREGHAKNQSV